MKVTADLYPCYSDIRIPVSKTGKKLKQEGVCNVLLRAGHTPTSPATNKILCRILPQHRTAVFFVGDAAIETSLQSHTLYNTKLRKISRNFLLKSTESLSVTLGFHYHL